MNFSVLNKNGRSSYCCSSSKEIIEVIFSQKILFLFIEMEAEITKLKYESQSPGRGILFLKKDQPERSSATVLQSRSVFLFSEITGIEEIGPQRKTDSENRGKEF